ncbi:Leucine-rich repeat protein [Handroanthus impetiginosus]|uniref:Leucine-rich repeat protein n=1 Tax=Handroanthus impetiginosus TaxID=429701 RepID=A0A2G9G2S5_9LAMI|nr:Leucine-rich repeat protein [Handroanthus impetiginosus]
MKFIQLPPLSLVLLLVNLRAPIHGHSYEMDIGATTIRCLESERQALLKFKDELIDAYGQLSSWGDEEHKRDCCKWKGVQCHNQNNHVTQLDLRYHFTDYNNAPLKCTISTSLLELQHLQYLDFSHNDFDHTPIPGFLASLNKLRHLDLSSANLRGPIPHHLGNLSKVSHLDLNYNPNCYSKSLEWVSHLHSLEYLDLSYTNLSEATNWLKKVSKLNFIKTLQMSRCELQDIPPFLFPSKINASTPLAILDLEGNSFKVSTLALIYWFSNFSNTGLTSIYFDGNSMPGGIPNYLGNMSNLTYLGLSGNNLTGELFELMMNLSEPVQEKLEYLSLRNNSIGESFSNMSRFSYLHLSENQLNGSILEGYLKLPHLLALDLSFNKLIGPVRESIGRLSRLRFLLISSNLLKGIITEDFMSDLSQLYVPPFQLQYLRLRHCILGPHFALWLKTQRQFWFIDISSVEISDNIPSWFIGNLASNFLYLNASNNQITGVFPDFSFSTISSPSNQRILDLSRNDISGSIYFLCRATGWDLIDLSNNHFLGHILDCFSHFEMLRYLNLANNNFFGKISYSFGPLNALSLLHLRNNSFSRELPSYMANLTKLIMIDVGKNRLTKKILDWIGDQLSGLKVLILRSNKFYGSIPSSLCDLANIQILDLSLNKIFGVIPNCVHKYLAMTERKNENTLVIANYTTLLGHSLGEIYQFQSAYFMWKGKETKYISGRNALEFQGVTTNNLSGCIPRNIGDLKSLDFLDFSRNHLSCSIPAGLGELTLGVLNLSYNNLSGKIPPTTQLLTYESTYIGNPNPCGLPLNKSCPGDESSHRDSDLGNNAMNNKEFEDDTLVTEEFYMAMGVGFLVGFWGIFGTILLNKAMRHAFFRVLSIVEDFVYVRMEITKARILRHFQSG